MKHWNTSCLCANRWWNKGLSEWNADLLRMRFHTFVVWCKVSANLKSYLAPSQESDWTYSNSSQLLQPHFHFLRWRLRGLPKDLTELTCEPQRDQKTCRCSWRPENIRLNVFSYWRSPSTAGACDAMLTSIVWHFSRHGCVVCVVCCPRAASQSGERGKKGRAVV